MSENEANDGGKKKKRKSHATSKPPVKVQADLHVQSENHKTTDTDSPDASVTLKKQTTTNQSTEYFLGIPYPKKDVTTVETVEVNANSGNTKTHTEHHDGIQGNLYINGQINKGSNGTPSIPTRNTPSRSHYAAAPVPRKPVVPVAPATDAVSLATSTTKDITDFDMNVDAREDAKKLAASFKKLQDTLGDNGIFPKAASIKIKGLEDPSKLAVLVQEDYTGKKEASITVNYTDHLGSAFGQSLAKIDVTHDNIDKLANAFDKATAAVKEMATKMKPGATVSQDEVSNIVRSTIKKEMVVSQ